MMFGGPKGCGKTTLARIVARAIVCADLDEGEPCGECEPCLSVSDESSTGFDEFDAATQGTVDRVRSLIEDLDYNTADGKPRVVILDEAHRLSKPSQDALLKSMEDRRLVVVLCTTEPRKIVEAIRSRVEEYPVGPPTAEVLVAHLSRICGLESITPEPEALSIIARAHSCCPRESVCSIDTLRTIGGVTASNAKSLFKHDRMQLVVEALSVVDTDPSAALSILDGLSVEGATWIRDTAVQAIASAMRQSVGARSPFPVPIGFFPTRGAGWASLARSLGSLDKPTMSDLEACLLSTLNSPPSSWVVSQPIVPSFVGPLSPVAPAPSPPLQPAPSVSAHSPPPTPSAIAKPQETPKEAPTKPKEPPVKPPDPPKNVSVEIDGVRFTSSEVLTSLDNKIEKGTSGPPTGQEQSHARVEYDQRHVPLPEKEFAHGLVRRVKGK